MKPLFIDFEGIDGSGKTSQIKRVEEKLKQADIPVISLKAPSDRRWGKLARNIISGNETKYSPREEMDIFIEDLADISLNLVSPALADGVTVLIDRYLFSTWAYQGVKHEDIDFVIEKIMECLCLPDLVCVLDIPVDVSLNRMETDSRGGDKYENRGFLEKVQKRYHSLVFDDARPEFMRRFENVEFFGIDAQRSKDEVTAYLVSEIMTRLYS